jgi:acetylornithine deacetylase/succinyl-diaminopimelate desuccinylase-like protein
MEQSLYEDLAREIDEKSLTESLTEMIALRSENPFHEEPRAGYREKEMGEYLSERLSGLGAEVSARDVRPGRPNVFGCLRGGEGKALMLAGHMDTARTDGYPGAYDVRVSHGRIYGRGSCDMKAALAAYLEVLRLLQRAKPALKGSLYVTGIMDEEFQMLGSQDIGANGPRADQGIIGEPTLLEVCPANKGRVSTFIRTRGKAAHSSVPETGENAIIRMANVIRAFSGYNDQLLSREPHPLCGNGRFNPGVIRGGVQVNMVPNLCELEVDRRTLPGETKESVYAEFREILEPLKKTDPGFAYEITEPSWLIPPNDIDPGEPVVQSLLKACAAATGQATEVTAFPAGSDAPHMGFPTVICGPGSISQAHTTDEFVEVEQLVQAARIYLWTVLDLLT